MTIEEILAKLSSGNKRFVEEKLRSDNRDSLRRKLIMDKQSPFAAILGCADSRIVPEIIFDTGLGELFVVRVGGNIACKSTVASIEYAVDELNTKVVIVLSHQDCGAVTAAINGDDCSHNLNYLLSQITPAINASAKTASINEVAKKNAELISNELIEKSAIIKKAVDNKTVKIVPAYYNLDSGKVDFL